MTLPQQRRYHRRLLAKIAARSAMANDSDIARTQQAREIDRYLSSHAVQSAIRYTNWRRSLGEREALRHWASAQATPVLPHDYRRFRAPTVPFFNKPRSTSGFRKVCAFGDIEKMWHIMARDLIVAQHRPRPHIGDWLGRGRDWQIDQIVSTLNSPRQTVVSADVVSAFAKVNVEIIYELPYLPEPLIRKALDYRSHRFVRRERSEYQHSVSKAYSRGAREDLERSPSGLMEGSPASNALFSVLLDDLPDHLEESIGAFVYCDNIILVAPTMSCALRAQEALARYLAGHRAGPFEMRSAVMEVSQRFEHLGYSLRRLPAMPPDVGISRNGWLRFADRLYAEPRDLEGAFAWLRASYGRCYRSNLTEFIQLVG